MSRLLRGHGESARDRGRGHDKLVWIKTAGLAFPEESKALSHAEAVLLVDDDEAELPEHDVILEEGMGADGDAGPSEDQVLERAPSLLCRKAPGEERNSYAKRRASR